MCTLSRQNYATFFDDASFSVHNPHFFNASQRKIVKNKKGGRHFPVSPLLKLSAINAQNQKNLFLTTSSSFLGGSSFNVFEKTNGFLICSSVVKTVTSGSYFQLQLVSTIL